MVGYFSLIAWCIFGMYDHFSTECIPSNQEKRGLHKDLDQFCLMGKKMSNFTKFLASKLHTNEMRWHWVQILWIKSCKVKMFEGFFLRSYNSLYIRWFDPNNKKNQKRKSRQQQFCFYYLFKKVIFWGQS